MKRSMWAMVSSDRAGAGGAVVVSAGTLADGVSCAPTDGLSAEEGWGAGGTAFADVAVAWRACSGSGASSSRSTSEAG